MCTHLAKKVLVKSQLRKVSVIKQYGKASQSKTVVKIAAQSYCAGERRK